MFHSLRHYFMLILYRRRTGAHTGSKCV
jgi:hypothetical protein